MEKRCFFIGHRDVPESILPLLMEEIERHIVAYGVTEFCVGHYGKFDSMAAQAVLQAKKKYSEIRLILVLPYHPAMRAVNIPDGFDGTIYPNGLETVPKRFAIVKANQYIVNQSDYLIAYVTHTMGNSGRLLEYAKKREQKGKIIISNIGN